MNLYNNKINECSLFYHLNEGLLKLLTNHSSLYKQIHLNILLDFYIYIFLFIESYLFSIFFVFVNLHDNSVVMHFCCKMQMFFLSKQYIMQIY